MDDLQELVQGNTAFAFDIYRQLCKPDGNLFFSPYSISVALAMTHAGARGVTEAEFAGGLHFTLSQKNLHPAFKTLRQVIGAAQGEHVALREANALWPHSDYRFSDEFINLLQTYYGASLTQLDYGEPEPARQIINDWVAEKTAGLICNLIPPGVLNSLTRFVLTNAIYFKGAWAERFDEEMTAPEPFWVTSEHDIPVSTMKMTGTFGYVETEHFQMLELPYCGQTLSMLIFLPVERDGLAALESDLDAKWLRPRRLPGVEVELSLPKFKLECKFQLNDVLRSLGVKEAFDLDKANFSGMDPNNLLYISAIIHQAFVDVSEEGTEAAAATAVMSLSFSVPESPVIFQANHPFLFVIRENRTGSILFMGRVQKPNRVNPKVTVTSIDQEKNMDVAKFTPSQLGGLRRAFKVLNRFMVFMWKLGVGRMINFWPTVVGRIMVIKHVGRKSGKVRFAPVNYAPIDGEIYCTAGFGAASDWYRNIMANPSVELWLPEGKFPATVDDVSDSPQRLFLLRQVLVASGFAAPLFGVNLKMSDEKLAALATDYRILHFIREK